MYKIKKLFEVLNLYKSIKTYNIFNSLRLVNKFEFDSNLNKLKLELVKFLLSLGSARVRLKT